MINIQLLRNATLIMTVNGKTILVDPMLGAKDSYDPIPNTANTLRNPLVDLPVSKKELDQLIARTDAVLLTHIHPDHWDLAAQQLIPKNTQVFCQPSDAQTIIQSGFTNVTPIHDELTWENIRFNCTGGRHGTGEIGKLMGGVSGYVLTHQEDILYLAGDTIWCAEVEEALHQYKPSSIVLNAGGARFQTGDAIVMNIPDIITVCNYAPDARIIVTHLEAINHSPESRAVIKAALKLHHLSSRCLVPEDGETVRLSR